MPSETLYRDGDRRIHFSSSDFLKEALDDFLESGANTSRFASAIIKVATGVELLLKDLLEQVCPALILDKLDEGGLQVAKVFYLGSKMRSPKELDTVELRIAPFPTLLGRTAKFFDLGDSAPHLLKLSKIRNSLIHLRGTVAVLEVNLLLVQQIFPLIEKLSKAHKYTALMISKETWDRIREVEKQSVDAISSQLAKKIAHYSRAFSRLSSKRKSLLAASPPEQKTTGADLIESNLSCPACKLETLAAFRDYDVDVEEGVIVGGSLIATMECRVCGLELEESEIQYIVENFEEYVIDNEREKAHWKEFIEPESPHWD